MASRYSLPQLFQRPFAALALCAMTGCGEATEAPRVELPVVTDGSALEDVTTDLGYRVHITAFRMAVSDLQFAVAGEVHAARRLLWPVAHAHPGHYTGGEVLGELAGWLLLDWRAREPGVLGIATLIAGKYDSVNFTLARARAEQGISETDPLFGHTALIEGTAERAGERATFSARIDSPAGRQIVGVPFDHEVHAAGGEQIAFAALTVDPLEHDTLFDGIDFLSLEVGENGLRVLDESSRDPETLAAYQRLRRTLQTHDHFRFHGVPERESP